MILVHKDVIQRLQKTSELLWIALVTSGLRIHSRLRNGNIELGLVTTHYQC